MAYSPVTLKGRTVRLGVAGDHVRLGISGRAVTLGIVHGEHRMASHRAGDDLDIFIPTIKDALGQLVPLTGATLYADVLLSTGAKVAAAGTWLDTGAGTGRARFSAAQTLTWPTNTDATYDARIKKQDGSIGTVAEGGFIILAPITPQPT